MLSLLKRSRHLELPIDLQLDLFEKCIYPILLYGCEVWGFEKMDFSRKLQLKFFKLLLGLKITTPNCMVYGELGKFPIEIEAKLRMLCFWCRLCNDISIGATKISSLLYMLCLSLYQSSEFKLPWIKYIHSVLKDLGLSYVWINQLQHHQSLDLLSFKKLAHQKLQDH